MSTTEPSKPPKAVPNMEDGFDPAEAVYTPAEFASFGVQEIKNIQINQSRSISLGIDKMDDYFAPVRPGQVCGLVGQTSHYKSGTLHFIEHQAAVQLEKEGRNDEVIVHVSTEEGTEEQSYLEMARYSKYEDSGKLARGEVKDLGDLIRVAFDKVSKTRIFHVGDSLGRSDMIPTLHLRNIVRSIDFIVKRFGVKIAMIGIDYLQAMPPDPSIMKYDFEMQRRLQVKADAYGMRQISSRFMAPTFVCAQAKQVLGMMQPVDSRRASATGVPLLIPGIYDVNESADVAQRWDRMLGLWMPKQSYPLGTLLKLAKDMTLEVTDNLLFIKVNKQRGGLPSGRTYICEVDFRTNTIEPKRDFG